VTAPKLSRPTYLVLALLLAWVLGVGGLVNGYSTLQYYRETTHSTPQLEAVKAPESMRKYLEAQRQLFEAQEKARTAVLDQYHDRMVPLAAANLVLSGLLIVACARALSGRARAHHLALQAVFANMGYAVVEFVANGPLRQAMAEATRQNALPNLDADQLAMATTWVYRFGLALQLLALALVALALTRPRVLAVYQPPASPNDEEA
jgi:hypothetical protein